MKPANADALINALVRWREHPVDFVREVFAVEPDAWQVDALEAFPRSPRLALKACKGPGKTAVLAWIGWNILLTRPHSHGGATSINGDNLRANLWTELARWRAKSPLIQSQFEQTKSEIVATAAPQTWKLEARTWARDATPDQIGNALAGLHGPYPFWLMDETGAYPDAIMPTAEAIFAGNPVEAHIVQAGNPLLRSGPLYRACTIARKIWAVVEITGDPDDPKRSPRIPVDYARSQIEQYGRDNPWVLVNIFGQFPPSSINSLIGPDEIAEAQRRSYREHDISHSSRLLGVDVARFGDDASVIFPRQGLVAFEPIVLRNVDGPQGAGHVARKWRDWSADACFIDDTGGYGASWIDALRQLGRSPIGVQFSGRASDPRYYNKRAEMYFECVEWIKRGGQLPPCPELSAALTQTTYSYRGDKLLLEDKSQVKDRLGYSPDHADALVQTFAQPIESVRALPGRPKMAVDYDPYSAFRQMPSGMRV